MSTLFAEQTPPDCPSDPGEKQDHLRALALAEIIRGRNSGTGSRGGPDITVVVDTTQPDEHGQPTIDWGLPVEIPHQVLADLFAVTDPHIVVIRNGIILHAPGNLNLGRTARVANRPQRRALRALCPTCAIPGCEVAYRHCKIHHVIWSATADGPTDLDNLLPVCEKHHHAIHDHDWQLHLTADRTLTITFPDGTHTTTGPPRRQPRRQPP